MITNPVFERIKQDIADNPIVLYMKGTPVFPQCGFSAAVVQMLTNLGVRFKGIDVLTDPSLRQCIKEFSQWPTIPQLYVKGEFVGVATSSARCTRPANSSSSWSSKASSTPATTR